MAVRIVHLVGVAVQPLQRQRVRCEQNVVVQVKVAGLLVVHMELERTSSDKEDQHSTSAPPRTWQPSECNRSDECPSRRHSPNPTPPVDRFVIPTHTSGRAMLGSFVGSSESKGMLSPMMP